jgi:hypothetical protein
MTPEERFDRIERQVEFLATHQAQLSTSLEALTKVVESHSQQIAQHTAQIGQLGDLFMRFGRIVERQVALWSALGNGLSVLGNGLKIWLRHRNKPIHASTL